jgi:hypothetical protein
LALALGLSASLLPVPPASAQGHPDCTQVLRELNHIGARDGAGTPEAARIATKLGTDATWVERCAASYGRRVKPKEEKATENDSEGLTAKVEEKEFEETAREEAGEQANIVQGDLDNFKPRDRIRGIDPDSSAEWEPYITHEWQPYTGHEWEPFILDDDHPNEE